MGNLLSKTDRKNQTIQYVYDALYRLTQKAYPDSTSVEYAYDLAGKVQQVSDPTGSYSFAYDNMGRLVGTTTQYCVAARSELPERVHLRRDVEPHVADGARRQHHDLRLRHAESPEWSGQFVGRIVRLRLRRAEPQNEPDASERSKHQLSTTIRVSHLLSVLHQAGVNTLDGASYTYDSAGNRTAKTNYLNGVTSNYGYDPLYELTQVTQGSSTTESYSYDAVGNRLSSSGVPDLQLQFVERADIEFNGQLHLRRKRQYPLRRQRQELHLGLREPAGAGGQCRVSGRRPSSTIPSVRRIQKSGPLGTTNYLYDGINPLEEVDSSGNVLARYTQTTKIDEELSEVRSGTTSYYQADGPGSITSLSNGAGALANTYTYDSFGNLTASSGTLVNPFRYTGREFDSETGVYFYRARYVDSGVGRFVSEDPLGFKGGINFYAFVLNNPVNLRDPLGLKACENCTNAAPLPANSPKCDSYGLRFAAMNAPRTRALDSPPSPLLCCVR